MVLLFGCSLNYLVPVGSSESLDLTKTTMEKNYSTLIGLKPAFVSREPEARNQRRLLQILRIKLSELYGTIFYINKNSDPALYPMSPKSIRIRIHNIFIYVHVPYTGCIVWKCDIKFAFI